MKTAQQPPPDVDAAVEQGPVASCVFEAVGCVLGTERIGVLEELREGECCRAACADGTLGRDYTEWHAHVEVEDVL